MCQLFNLLKLIYLISILTGDRNLQFRYLKKIGIGDSPLARPLTSYFPS